jgi:phage anti-repressor protein
MTELNIVELIEKNPITKLSNNYNNKLLNKIKENFNEIEQKLFVSSFYCYLNYNKNNDFVIDLDNVWKWLGFNQKYNALRVLEKNFILDKDYINFAPQVGGAKNEPNNNDEKNKKEDNRGGHNKQTFMMTINCFKKFCLKADTKKAHEIHEYYIKMEETLHEIIEEESNELRLQLEQKEEELEVSKLNSEKEKLKAAEKATILQFPVNTECIYFGIINNTKELNEKLIKFGHTNNLAVRVREHKKNYDDFILINAFKVQNKVEIENLIKKDNRIKNQIRSIEIENKIKNEIIAYDNHFTIEKLTYYIKDIIRSKTYNIENFNKLTERNNFLENENSYLNEERIKKDEIINKLNLEIIELKQKIEKQNITIESINKEEESVYKNTLIPEDDLHKQFNDFINEICIVRPDVEELSVNLEGRYRLWNQKKPSKEVFHALKNYLDFRFKPKKIKTQHGYLGIKLKEVEYKKRLINSDIEAFIFEKCKFFDSGKVLNSILLKEYQKWKGSINKIISENDIKDIKTYLNECPYALKATVWTEHGNNEGYYGLCLNEDFYETKVKQNNTRGKIIQKKNIKSNDLLGTWESIFSASIHENISRAKMSRCVKNKTIINDYYYCLA